MVTEKLKPCPEYGKTTYLDFVVRCLEMAKDIETKAELYETKAREIRERTER